jgi:hypothetical protein
MDSCKGTGLGHLRLSTAAMNRLAADLYQGKVGLVDPTLEQVVRIVPGTTKARVLGELKRRKDAAASTNGHNGSGNGHRANGHTGNGHAESAVPPTFKPTEPNGPTVCEAITDVGATMRPFHVRVLTAAWITLWLPSERKPYA